MILELAAHDYTDSGEYTHVLVGAGRVVASVAVEDGMFGRKVSVVVDGETHVIEVDS